MADSTCYNRLGHQDPSLTPCSTDGSLPHCCNADWHCATNGLCVRRDPLNEATPHAYAIAGCIDENWDDEGCVDHCKDIGFFVESCNNFQGQGSGFSCVDRLGELDCNSSREMFFTLDQVRLAPSPSVSASASSSQATTTSGAPSSSQTTTTSETADPTSDTTDPTSEPNVNYEGPEVNTLAIGLGVGLGICIAVIAVAAYMFFRRRRRGRHNGALSPAETGAETAPFHIVSSPSPAASEQKQSEGPTPEGHTYKQDHRGDGVYELGPTVYEAPGDTGPGGEHRYG